MNELMQSVDAVSSCVDMVGEFSCRNSRGVTRNRRPVICSDIGGTSEKRSRWHRRVPFPSRQRDGALLICSDASRTIVANNHRTVRVLTGESAVSSELDDYMSLYLRGIKQRIFC